MNNNTRKIVVLDKLDSSRIEQAIFILRDTKNISPSDAVSEAQRIVDDYLRTISQSTFKKTVKKPRAKFIIGMILYTFTTMVLTTYLLAFIR